jgi:hypothetical protein
MTATNTARVVLLAGLLLGPAARADQPAANEDAVNMCVEMRERIYECKEPFADAFVEHHNPPAAERAKMRAKALEEITNDGSGPIGPRRQACVDTVKGSKVPPPEKVRELKEGLARCAAEADCDKRVACLMPLIRPMVGKGRTVKR